jgi:hypothetical protein
LIGLCWNICRGQGGVRCVRFERYAVGKLHIGNGCKGDDGLGLVVDSKLSCPAVFNNIDLPKAILGVASPLQYGLVVQCDFATCFVKNLAACIAQYDEGENIVDKAKELMC